MGEDKNVWDRPWSVDEMRDNATGWSLASDAGVRPNLNGNCPNKLLYFPVRID